MAVLQLVVTPLNKVNRDWSFHMSDGLCHWVGRDVIL